MITWHYNHPSIILWGVRINESPDDHDFYEKTAEIARKLDSDRPLGGVRNFKKSEMLEDIYTYNDFSHTGNNAGWAKPRKITGKLLPYLVTEHNGHLFPTKKFDHDEKRREHALRHLKVIDTAFQNDLISGAIGWCMNDYNTHIEFGSGDRICYHGVLDMFRIPKYAASVYASQQNKKPVLTVASNMTMGDHAKSMVPQTLVFTNCDYIKVYRNDTYIDTFYSAWDDFPSIPFAPIVVDDYVGNRILTEESYKPRIANRIKKVLITVNRNDLMSKIKNGFRMFNLTFLHKLTYADALHLYGKYIGDWGQEGGQYLFEGYIDDVCVISVKKGSNQSSVIQAIADDTSLNHSDTYDATRIVIRKVDEFGNDLVYANDVLNIETSEHLSVIGPKQLALIGGSVGIYVKTTGIKGEGFVKISVDNEAPIVLTFEIH
jgi:beta-galactosidase